MHEQIICEAIGRHRLLRFRYKDHGTTTVVEPYAFGMNTSGHQALRAWLREGATHSTVGSRWRMYFPVEMRVLQILEEPFDPVRPGYKSVDHGFTHIVCSVTETNG
jgi:hypothetical protein